MDHALPIARLDNDDPNGPTPSKRRQDPKSRDLQDNEEGEEDGNDLMVIGKQPHPSQPSGMQQNNKRKMRPAVLDTTGGQQPPLVSFSPPEFGQALHREVGKKDRARAEIHQRSATTK